MKLFVKNYEFRFEFPVKQGLYRNGMYQN